MQVMLSPLLFALVLLSNKVSTAPAASIVKLSYGSFQGKVSGNTNQFLGIPYATPPTGQLRFALPKAPAKFTGTRQATFFGHACPQLSTPVPSNVSFPSVVPDGPVVGISEDCLTLNVIQPSNTATGAKLPVLFYIHGGGFVIGGSSQYDGTNIVARSIALGQPVIFISINYRLNAFGFLGGKEIKAAGLGNVGLYDQRFALQWVQDQIAVFGGDPTKVTIWGESAGAVNVGMQMIINNGDPAGLYSAAIMESGSPNVLVNTVDTQPLFDNIAKAAGCGTSSDKLSCLRNVPYSKFMDAVNTSPSLFSQQSLNLSFHPTIDGKLILRDPLTSLQNGQYAKVPIITGDCEDEGTEFSFSIQNVNNNDAFLKYVKENYLPDISDADLQALSRAYPDDITQGSPFNTGTANTITPEFKRLAAIQGDFSFQAPRRFYLGIASKTQPTYGFRYLPRVSNPGFGSVHGGDLAEFFSWNSNSARYIGTDALVFFGNTRNPNAPSSSSISLLRNINWPQWSSSTTNPPLLTFLDSSPYINITSDTYRAEGMDLLQRLLLDKVL